MLEGHCLCGRVSCKIESASGKIDLCHCSMCRRQGAGPLHFVEWSSDNAFEILTGQEFVKIYRSSTKAERAFCSNCGTFLYWKKLENEVLTPNAELFDRLIQQASLGTEYYYDCKPDYYDLQGETLKLDSEFNPIKEQKNDIQNG